MRHQDFLFSLLSRTACSALSKGVQTGHMKCFRFREGKKRLKSAVISQPGFEMSPPTRNEIPRNSSPTILMTSNRPGATNGIRLRVMMPKIIRVIRPKRSGLSLAKLCSSFISSPPGKKLNQYSVAKLTSSIQNSCHKGTKPLRI